MFSFITSFLGKLGLPFLEDLGAAIKNLLLGIFLYKAGANKVLLNSNEKEVADAKQAQNLVSSVQSNSRDELINELCNPTESSTDK